MKKILITYDLNRERQANKWETVNKAIAEQFPSAHWRRLTTTWIVETDWSAAQVRNWLLPLFDSNDELLVAVLTGEAAWHGIDERGSTWLRDVLPR